MRRDGLASASGAFVVVLVHYQDHRITVDGGLTLQIQIRTVGVCVRFFSSFFSFVRSFSLSNLFESVQSVFHSDR